MRSTVAGPAIYLYPCDFPNIGVPQNGWFLMENSIKMDDLGVPLFLETPICWISTQYRQSRHWQARFWSLLRHHLSTEIGVAGSSHAEQVMLFIRPVQVAPKNLDQC